MFGNNGNIGAIHICNQTDNKNIAANPQRKRPGESFAGVKQNHYVT